MADYMRLHATPTRKTGNRSLIQGYTAKLAHDKSIVLQKRIEKEIITLLRPVRSENEIESQHFTHKCI